MMSFNYYAFGSVADWIHRVIWEIAPAEPGYKHIAIALVPGGDITSANFRFISPYGEITSRWRLGDEEGFHLDGTLASRPILRRLSLCHMEVGTAGSGPDATSSKLRDNVKSFNELR
jgi:hypothetical protein